MAGPPRDLAPFPEGYETGTAPGPPPPSGFPPPGPRDRAFGPGQRKRGRIAPAPFQFESSRRDGERLSIHVVVSAVATAAVAFLLLGGVGDEGVGGEEQGRDAGGVLEGRPGDLGGVDD